MTPGREEKRPEWIREHVLRAREKLRSVSEEERQGYLAGVEATLAVEGLTVPDELRQLLLAYARGDASAEELDAWVHRLAH